MTRGKTGASAIWRNGGARTSHSAHVCRRCACAVHGVWRDARFRSILAVFTCDERPRNCLPRYDCGGPRLPTQPMHAGLRLPLPPQRSSSSLSLSVLTSTACKHSQPVSSPHKTLLRPLPELTSTNIHYSPTPHPRLTLPTSQTHSLTPRTNQTTTLQLSTWAR